MLKVYYIFSKSVLSKIKIRIEQIVIFERFTFFSFLIFGIKVALINCTIIIEEDNDKNV